MRVSTIILTAVVCLLSFAALMFLLSSSRDSVSYLNLAINIVLLGIALSAMTAWRYQRRESYRFSLIDDYKSDVFNFFAHLAVFDSTILQVNDKYRQQENLKNKVSLDKVEASYKKVIFSRNKLSVFCKLKDIASFKRDTVKDLYQLIKCTRHLKSFVDSYFEEQNIDSSKKYQEFKSLYSDWRTLFDRISNTTHDDILSLDISIVN